MNNKLKALVNTPVSLLKGLRVTLTNLARTKATVRYPEVMPTPTGQTPRPAGGDPFERPYEIAPRFRGLHGLTKDETGDLNCIGCMACAKVCPDNLISMDLEKREGHSGRFPVTFHVNIGPCCFCGLCAEVCPTPMRAIVMTDFFEWAAYRRDGANLVLGRDDLERHGEAEVARRRAGRQWQDGELVGVNPEEEGNPYFQFAPEYAAARRKGDSGEQADQPARPAKPAAPAAAPTAVAAPEPAAALEPAPEPVAVAPAEPVDEVAELRAKIAAALAGSEFAGCAEPEKLTLEALDALADRKVRAQAKSAVRKLQKALGLVE